MYYDTIKEHALRDAPNECCGFVFKESGTYIARPVENVWVPPEERLNRFRMPANAVLEAIRSKALVGYYHSHVEDRSGHFSEIDKAMVEEFGYPCYLYTVPTDQFTVHHPTGQKPGLIGRPYVPLVYGCVSLVRDYFDETFHIDLPDFPYTSNEIKNGGQIGVSKYFEDNSFKRVTGSNVKHGDIILMIVRCHNLPNHVGVITEDGELLHHLFNQVSRKEIYDGYWKRVTCNIYRRTDLK